jgi:tight adherence protein C
MILAGLGIGIGFSLGALALANWRVTTRRTLSRDISRHVGGSIEESRFKGLSQLIVHRIFATSAKSPWGSDRQIDKLIAQSRVDQTRMSVRSQQLLALAAGLALLTFWTMARQLTHHQNNLVLVGALLIGVFPLSGWIIKESLRDDVAKRSRLVAAKLPGTLELLAFCVSAGEPVVSGLNRVAALSKGVLADSLVLAIARINAGTPMAHALRELSNSVDSPQMTRAVHAIELALERGTPLADVLRAQASDARAQHARELMILAGKKETAMLLPVVFFILPMIVLVAIYPGLIALRVL